MSHQVQLRELCGQYVFQFKIEAEARALALAEPVRQVVVMRHRTFTKKVKEMR